MATVLAAEWPFLTTMFDGDVASGPVPHLFANCPREAKAALSSDPARAFRDLQRIWSKFFVPENLAPSKSWDFLNNIRSVLIATLPAQYSKIHFMPQIQQRYG